MHPPGGRRCPGVAERPATPGPAPRGRYDYRAQAITPDMYLGWLPDYLLRLAQHLHDSTGLTFA